MIYQWIVMDSLFSTQILEHEELSESLLDVYPTDDKHDLMTRSAPWWSKMLSTG